MTDEVPRNELRDWIKANSQLVTVTSFMIAAAVFSKNIGTGKSVVLLISVFLFMTLILIQEMFGTFPPPGHDSSKLFMFKWALGAAWGQLAFYWLWLTYTTFGQWWLGILGSYLGIDLATAIVKRIAYWQGKRRPQVITRRLFIAGMAAAGTLFATRGVPWLAPAIATQFFVSDSVATAVDSTTARGLADTVSESIPTARDSGTGRDSSRSR